MTLNVAEEAEWPPGYPEEHKGPTASIVWQGGDAQAGRPFRVVASAHVGGARLGLPGSDMRVSMTAEAINSYDALGNPKWERVEDPALEAKYIAIAVYAKLVGLPSKFE